MEYAKPPGSVHATPRRIVTAPTPAPLRISRSPSQSSLSSSSSSTAPHSGIETLYSHPSVKIIAFTAGPRSFSVTAGGGITSPVDVEPGTLPWSSQLERTIAVGPFRIYRAPGSVAFLNCGSALQPILPKSQCWCIDEISSKFVLQIRRPQYWRIEIPIGDKADCATAQALRDVFDKVLQFEKTPCPFQRAFTVELPEPPQTPVKKRPWTPVRRTSIQLPPTPITPDDLTPRVALMGERRRRTSISKRPEESPEEQVLTPTLTPTLPVIEKIRREEGSRGNGRPELVAECKVEPSRNAEAAPIPAMPRQHPSFQASRSIAAPPQLALVTASSPPRSIVTTESTVSESAESSVANSPTDSSASFHSMQSWHSPIATLPPSPPMSNPNSPKTFPYPHENIPMPQPTATSREEKSDVAALVESLETCDISPASAIDGAASDTNDLSSVGSVEYEAVSSSSDGASVLSFEETSPVPVAQAPANASTDASPRPRLRHRTTSRSSISSVGHYRALSPLPPAANLFTPRSRFRAVADTPERAKTRLEAVRRIPGAIIHKTCEILLSPPGHLINLMLKVAARIAAGEWRGLVFGVGEGGEQIPVQWDYSDSDAGGSGVGHWDVDGDVYAAVAAQRGSGWDSSPAATPKAIGAGTVDATDLDEDVAGGWSQSWEVD